jgi:phosphoglycerate dehydrogenase-like enzyme
MKVYTDLQKRTKMYSLPEWGFTKLNSAGIDIVTEYDDDVKVYWGDLLTKKDVENLPNLKWIHFPCVGVNRAMIPEVRYKGITVTNSPNIFTESVSSMVLSYILYFSKGLNFVNKLREEDNLTRESFDEYVNYFVINLLPLTTQTKSIFNKKVFGKMKNNSYFINVGRGQTVVEEDLIEALRSKTILGCALDVFNVEPLSKESELWSMDNVLITPHIANVNKNYWKTQIELFISNLNRFRTNNTLLNVVNLNRGY